MALKSFLHTPSATGLALLASALAGIGIASSPLRDGYQAFLNFEPLSFFPLSGLEWINEGLLGFFFALLGIELREDFEVGPLKNLKKALFPFFGALGGMALPAFIALSAALCAPQSAGLGGWAIPTATDAALTVPLLAMARGLPASIRSFVGALAVFDDLGAIFILAVFYGHRPDLIWLLISLLPLLLLIGLPKLLSGAKTVLYVSLPLTFLLWLCLCKAGIAPELAGLALGLALPRPSGSLLYHFLELPVAWLILPLFAFCNTGIDLTKLEFVYLESGAFLGPFWGLFLGKPLGIGLTVLLCEKTALPAPWQESERHWLLGAFLSCGIGFTISLLLSRLAYPVPAYQMQAAAGVALASSLSALGAYFLLKRSAAIQHCQL